MIGASLGPWPSYSEEEIEAVAGVLRSGRVNYWTGQECKAFEQEFAAICGAAHAVCLANGTLALDAALFALGIGAGDEVIVTPRSFIASVSSVVNAGAAPVFADVDHDSGNLSPATIAPLLTERTRAIVPVHLAGWPCDMAGILELAAPRGIAVIEDCAQALGARIDGKLVGTFGDIGAFSFCQDKIVSTGGEGGMAVTSDKSLWQRMWSFKDHGKDWFAAHEREHPPGFRWLSEDFGTNARMSEMQAAIGRIQLRRLDRWIGRRRAIARRIVEALAPFAGAVRAPQPEVGLTHAWYRLYAYVRPDGLRDGWDRNRIVAEVQAQGVPLQHGCCPEIYREKAFAATPWRPAQRLPVARELGETSLMFLIHPTLCDRDVERIVSAATKVLERAIR